MEEDSQCHLVHYYFDLASTLFASSSFSVQGSVFRRIDALLGGFRVGGVHDSYTFQCGLVGSFTWHRHQIEGTDGFYCLLRKTLAKRGKRSCQSSEAKSFTAVGLEHSTFRSPVERSNPLGHSAPSVFKCVVTKSA